MRLNYPSQFLFCLCLNSYITNIDVYRGDDLIYSNVSSSADINIGDIGLIRDVNLDFYNLVAVYLGGNTSNYLNNCADLISNDGTLMKIKFNVNLTQLESIDVLPNTIPNGIIRLKTFSLDNIDEMREAILSKSNSTVPFNINDDCYILPYAGVS